MGSTRPVHIYVDGSCGENRNVTSDTKAGWGFCVISEDTGSGNCLLYTSDAADD